MWILLWQNWCSRLFRARNVMKQRHDMEWHSHTQSLYDTIFISSFFGGSSSGRLSKKIYEICWWEIGEVGPLLVVSIFALSWIRFHHTSFHHSLSGHIWILKLESQFLLLIIIHSCIPALGWPKTAQSVHCCSRSPILLSFCLKTYKT